jgi:hypothetical protein
LKLALLPALMALAIVLGTRGSLTDSGSTPAEATASPVLQAVAPDLVDWLLDGQNPGCTTTDGVDVASGAAAGPNTCVGTFSPADGNIIAADGLGTGATAALELGVLGATLGDDDGLLEVGELTAVDVDGHAFTTPGCSVALGTCSQISVAAASATLANGLSVFAFVDNAAAVDDVTFTLGAAVLPTLAWDGDLTPADGIIVCGVGSPEYAAVFGSDPDCDDAIAAGDDGIVVANIEATAAGAPAIALGAVSVAQAPGAAAVHSLSLRGAPVATLPAPLVTTFKAGGNAPDCTNGPETADSLKTLARATEHAESPEDEIVAALITDATGSPLNRQVFSWTASAPATADIAIGDFISINASGTPSAFNLVCTGTAGAASVTADPAALPPAGDVLIPITVDPSVPNLRLDLDPGTAGIQDTRSVTTGSTFCAAWTVLNSPGAIGAFDLQVTYNPALVTGINDSDGSEVTNDEHDNGGGNDNPDLNDVAGGSIPGCATLETGFMNTSHDTTGSGTTEPKEDQVEDDYLFGVIGGFSATATLGAGNGDLAYMGFTAGAPGTGSTACQLEDQLGPVTAACPTAGDTGLGDPNGEDDDTFNNNMHIQNASFADAGGTEVGSCHTFITTAMYCGDADITILPAPPAADVEAVSKTCSPDPVVVGQLGFACVIVIQNNGPAATTITMTDVFPAGFTPGAATVSGAGAMVTADCTTVLQTVTCTTAAYPSGDTDTITIPVAVSAAAVGNTCNTATVSGSTPDPVSANDSAMDCTTVNPPDVAMFKKVEEPHGTQVVAIDDGVAVNLWVCEDPACILNGQGHLDLDEILVNDTDPDGTGAFEFQVKFDHKIFDIVVTSGGYLDTDGTELSVIGEAVADRTENCTITTISENDIKFACVSSGGAVGPSSLNIENVIANIDVDYESDIPSRIVPGQENGIVRLIADENCEVADIYGDPLRDGALPGAGSDAYDNDDDGTVDEADEDDFHSGWSVDGYDNNNNGLVDEAEEGGSLLPGIVTGGLVERCDDVVVTVRRLEADLDSDCEVDVVDAQLEAVRYGATIGSLRYDRFYDLEPALGDMDIDVKDVQKVFGRLGSTCEDPIPPQAPIEFGIIIGF